ncbi:hypothetical protein Apa02nite_001690 [Actinoplanes palleronii]|uniref:Uncharacterized protein n=1 Tax=Actinoplanes palleronii TaxID=113570 RepID=A0ABQ4B0Q0_9ACTN|nr:hypothetical protein Apa02nite_001690 [Actinoplanes palleronii]
MIHPAADDEVTCRIVLDGAMVAEVTRPRVAFTAEKSRPPPETSPTRPYPARPRRHLGPDAARRVEPAVSYPPRTA